MSEALAQTVAAELGSGAEGQVIPLYTEALGPAVSGTEIFIKMFTIRKAVYLGSADDADHLLVFAERY